MILVFYIKISNCLRTRRFDSNRTRSKALHLTTGLLKMDNEYYSKRCILSILSSETGDDSPSLQKQTNKQTKQNKTTGNVLQDQQATCTNILYIKLFYFEA